jgi:hypothetical protein
VPITAAYGCIISRLPTSPLELPSPSSPELSRIRGVPMPLAHMITTSALWWRSSPFSSR